MNEDLLHFFPEIQDFSTDSPEDFSSVSFGNAQDIDSYQLFSETAGNINTVFNTNSYYIPTDSNGDGFADSIATGIDIDSDGMIDVQYGNIDTNYDGLADTHFCMCDFNGDGIADITEQQTAFDYNRDGLADTYISLTDNDSDGLANIVKQSSVIDYNFDRIGDAYIETITDAHCPESALVSIYADSDGDHIWQAEQSFVINDGSVFIAQETGLSSVDAYQPFDPETANMDYIIGDPESYMDNWHTQETSFSCAVASQEFIIEELLGVNFDEAELRRFSVKNGWLTEAGTPFEDIGNLMSYMGLRVERSTGNTFGDLCDSLNKSSNPIVCVDTGELWSGLGDDFYMPGSGSFHAIQVIGVDTSDPDNPMVILNDSGCTNGCGAMIEKDVFLDAWNDCDNYMVEAYL